MRVATSVEAMSKVDPRRAPKSQIAHMALCQAHDAHRHRDLWWGELDFSPRTLRAMRRRDVRSGGRDVHVMPVDEPGGRAIDTRATSLVHVTICACDVAFYATGHHDAVMQGIHRNGTILLKKLM